MRIAAGLAGVLAAVLAGGCSQSVRSLSFPDAPKVTIAPGATNVSGLSNDLSSVTELPVPGASTTTMPTAGPGPYTLSGTVTGPSGPIPGATVEADRFVEDAMVPVRTSTAADGTWSIPNILGGRYRVRSWRTPSLGMATPQLLFLAGNQNQSIGLQLQLFQGPNVSAAINPPAPVVGQPANLVLQVTNPTVGNDGVLRYTPIGGSPVTLVNGPQWLVSNGNPQTTDGNGQVIFQVSCTQVGTDPLSAQVDTNQPTTLPVPACASPAPVAPPTVAPATTAPPLTAFPGATTTTPSSSTTPTTCPQKTTKHGRQTTTTTTIVGVC